MLTQHTPSLLTTIEKPHVDLEDRGIEEAKSADPLYTQITSSPPYPYLLTFLPFILSFICAFFLFALPSFASDKLLFKFVECTQTSGLNEVLVFERHSALFFFRSFGYE